MGFCEVKSVLIHAGFLGFLVNQTDWVVPMRNLGVITFPVLYRFISGEFLRSEKQWV